MLYYLRRNILVASPVFSFTQGIIQFICNGDCYFFASFELRHPDATVPHVDILPLKKNTVLQPLTSVYPDCVDDPDFIFVPHFVLRDYANFSRKIFYHTIPRVPHGHPFSTYAHALCELFRHFLSSPSITGHCLCEDFPIILFGGLPAAGYAEKSFSMQMFGEHVRAKTNLFLCRFEGKNQKMRVRRGRLFE